MTANTTTVSFDLIDTLIDADAGVAEWFRHHLRDHDRQASNDEILAAYREALATVEQDHPELSLTALLPRVYGHIARAWELDTDESAALDFRDSIHDWPPFRDAIPCLRQLGEHYTLAAVTRADDWGMEAMARTLGEPFAVQVTYDTEALREHRHDLWSALLEALGCPPNEVLHCTAGSDTTAAQARAAGLPVIRLRRAATTGRTAAETARDPIEAAAADDINQLSELVAHLRGAASA